MTVVAPFLTFPNIRWWMQAAYADTVILDSDEHFEKMTYRNRYRISGSNNSILLSIPLVKGRNQHVPMRDVQIHNQDRWQTQHWRTLVSVYRRAPFFDHYEDLLRPMFETEYDHLTDFNRASILWVQQQLRLKFKIEETNEYLKEYPSDVADIRGENYKEQAADFPKYYQVFEDRIGFQPDLSILDLLFSEGPGAVNWLRS
jgi:hypothetical protein